MREVARLFEKALGLTTPWKVERSEFDPEGKRLDLFLDFERGARFACPSCGAAGCAVYDSEDKQWRHLDFFQYRAYLHARVPRIRCARCGVHQVEPPWARPGSGFTHLFEAFVMTLAAEMPVRAIADLLGEHDTRIWRLVHFHIARARALEDFSHVRHLGVDETSLRRGQSYVSLFCDLERAKLLFATPGHGADTFARFCADLTAHGGDPAQLRELCMDMSPRYLAGAREHLPGVPITFDRLSVEGPSVKRSGRSLSIASVRSRGQGGAPAAQARTNDLEAGEDGCTVRAATGARFVRSSPLPSARGPTREAERGAAQAYLGARIAPAT